MPISPPDTFAPFGRKAIASGDVRALATDNSVLVDLERGGLLSAAFRLPCKFTVTDLLYKRELLPHGGDRLMRLGLTVAELEPSEMDRAIALHRRTPSLSLADCSILELARYRRCTLLTGDKELRRTAESESIQCHGLLWLLDKIRRAATATPQQLHRGLKAIADHPRCRLPESAIRQRLVAYAHPP